MLATSVMGNVHTPFAGAKSAAASHLSKPQMFVYLPCNFSLAKPLMYVELIYRISLGMPGGI